MSSFISPKAEIPDIMRGRRTLEEELRSNNSKDNYSQILKEESDIKLNPRKVILFQILLAMSCIFI